MYFPQGQDTVCFDPHLKDTQMPNEEKQTQTSFSTEFDKLFYYAEIIGKRQDGSELEHYYLPLCGKKEI